VIFREFAMDQCFSENFGGHRQTVLATEHREEGASTIGCFCYLDVLTPKLQHVLQLLTVTRMNPRPTLVQEGLVASRVQKRHSLLRPTPTLNMSQTT